ncbi:G2 and S phase-expressed protein 1 [Sciurus carolinensis]|uniref:G2 and S phase-expressed protein 1 n=1 Tax=Sciurus carolinensis TaxID=30640 RepID=A0AA41NF68_SCICA|nr:G2 and S phase-expressed protein 1 [Sciurus carolinensis]
MGFAPPKDSSSGFWDYPIWPLWLRNVLANGEPQLRGGRGVLLADEKFDFDLSLSSSSANEDDEVFFGPVGHRERCIAASLELSSQIAAPPRLPACDSARALSPLSAEKFVEVYREARLLALQLERHSREEAQAAEPGSSSSQGVERFIQESKLKVKLFEKEQEMEKSPKSLKRETYYLSDSPFQGLPSSGEPLFQASPQALPSAPVQVGPVLTQGPPPSSRPLLGEPAAVHPSDQAVPQKRVVSKLQLPRASFVRGRHLPSAIEKALLIDVGLGQLAITCGAESTPPADLLLIDFSSPPQADVASGPASRPLTDLTTNTPDMLRNSASKPSQVEGQLIDLGSPLIQLSPEADKENVDSPLLKF